jgi:hypothetical protein
MTYPLFHAHTVEEALRRLRADVVEEVGDTKKLRAFEAFHRLHPNVYRLVEHFALRVWHQRGHDAHYGIGMVWERVRWEVRVEARDVEGFKLNNNFRALYARLFLLHHPECAGLLELRRLHPEGGMVPLVAGPGERGERVSS